MRQSKKEGRREGDTEEGGEPKKRGDGSSQFICIKKKKPNVNCKSPSLYVQRNLIQTFGSGTNSSRSYPSLLLHGTKSDNSTLLMEPSRISCKYK